MRPQPAGVVLAAVAAAPLHAQQALIDACVDSAEVLVHIHNLQHLLAGHAVHAFRAGAVVPQPLMMKRADPPIGPLHTNLII